MRTDYFGSATARRALQQRHAEPKLTRASGDDVVWPTRRAHDATLCGLRPRTQSEVIIRFWIVSILLAMAGLGLLKVL